MGLYSDIQLIERVQASDEDAFNQLYQRYWKMLFMLAWKKTGDKEDAADLIQELFIEIWNRRAAFKVDRSLQTYLVSCVYFKVFNHFRAKGVKEKHARQFEDYLERSGAGAVPVATLLEEVEDEYGKMQDVIEQTVGLMPEKMQKVFRMSLYQRQSISQIAARLEVSPHTVKSHLQAAMAQLRKVAEEHSAEMTTLLAVIAVHELILS
jgi:RNA polymerase sigma-70 factor (family 1)